MERGWGYPIPDGYGDGTINSNSCLPVLEGEALALAGAIKFASSFGDQ